MTTRPLDLFGDGDIAGFHRVRWASLRHGRPEGVPSLLAEFTHTWRSGPADDGWRKAAVGAFDHGELVAVAWVQESIEDALDAAWAGVHTDPGRRCEGWGSSALSAVLPLVSPGRTRLLASAIVPTEQASERGYRRFAERHGAHVATSVTTVELALPADLPDEAAPAGYRVASHVDGVPEEHRAGLGILKGLVDSEAPSGDIEWDPSPVTPEHYAREIAALTATGGHAIETVALDDATGEVVAFTEMAAFADPARPVAQEGTLVRSDHRGRGLGRAVKIANLHALRASLPGHGVIRSESDDANMWMHAVNAALGFRPVESILYLEAAHPGGVQQSPRARS